MNAKAASRHSSGLGGTGQAGMSAEGAYIGGDSALLGACRAGDSAAWRVLYGTHFRFVHRVAQSLGTPGEELEDVCQDVFVVAFKKLSAFREGQIRTWLYRIAANVVSSRHRRRRLERALHSFLGTAPAAEHAPGADRAVETRQAGELVSRALERMAPLKREVFVLYEIEGLSGAEIAELVGCPPETVRTRLFHARKEFERFVERSP